MDQLQDKDHKLKDITYSWVDSSVFLFYLEVFCIVAFLIGATYGLYAHRYKGKPEVEIPGNTLYTPTYK
jgi:Mn2+/Fe2+ NRAMP family transporter